MTYGELGPYVVTAALAIGAFLFARRFGSSTAMATLEQANNILEKRVHEQDVEIKALRVELETLRSRTDVALAMAPVLDALRTHERQAEVRNDRTFGVLEQIANLLGPEAKAA